MSRRSSVPYLVQRQESDEAIEFNHHARILPGEYPAYCTWAGKYFDRHFQRWTCLLRWDAISEKFEETIGARIPMWFRLGDGEKPRVSRRSKFLIEWIRANGGPPGKGDRLSPKVFTRRIARVEIGDTAGPAPYSVVRRIIHWETGATGNNSAPNGPENRVRSRIR